MFNVLLAWVELTVDRPDLLKSSSEAFSTGAIVPEDGQEYLFDINKVPQNRCECCNDRAHIINASVRLHRPGWHRTIARAHWVTQILPFDGSSDIYKYIYDVIPTSLHF